MSAGAQHAPHFREAAGPGFHVAQAEGDGERVEDGVGEREAQAVGDDERIETLAFCDEQHRMAEIRAHEK